LHSQTHDAGMLGQYLTLDLLIAITPQGSSKATEVGLALFGESAKECRAVRVALLDEERLPLANRFHDDRFEVEVPPLAHPKRVPSADDSAGG